jgi:hypothetical protein
MMITLASFARPLVWTRRFRCFGRTITGTSKTPAVRGTLPHYGQGIEVGQYAEVSEYFCRIMLDSDTDSDR